MDNTNTKFRPLTSEEFSSLVPANLEWSHESKYFPLMSDGALAGLIRDITDHGQTDPITLSANLKEIVDGRNRNLAHLKGNIPFDIDHFRVICTDDPSERLQFTVGENIRRRHMSAGQRACAGAQLYDAFQAWVDAQVQAGVAQDKATEAVRDQIGLMFGISGRYVDLARQLQREAPDLFERVLDTYDDATQVGEANGLTLSKALTALKDRKNPKNKNTVFMKPSGVKFSNTELANLQAKVNSGKVQVSREQLFSLLTCADYFLSKYGYEPELKALLGIEDAPETGEKATNSESPESTPETPAAKPKKGKGKKTAA